MNKIFTSFIISAMAGFSTLFGIIPCLFNKKYQDKVITFSLAFSAGVMMSISLISLIPEGIRFLFPIFKIFPLFIISLIFVILGILLSFFTSSIIDKRLESSKLYKLGIISLIVLILHNIPEGLTTFLSSSINTKLGISIALAIALHNIPEGIAIAIPLYYSTNNFKKAFFFTFIAGFSELFGAILGYLFLARFMSNLILGIILIITAGIMIHISMYELIPKAFEYQEKKTSILAFIIGIISFIICEMLLI